MSRLLLSVVTLLGVLWGLLTLGLVPGPLVPLAHWVWGTATSLASTFFVLSLFYAPGIYREAYADLRRLFGRLGFRHREIEDLERKIAHLDKPHHMLQLGTLLARQGRHAAAERWLAEAARREPQSVEAQYRLAASLFELGRAAEAAPLFEQVHQAKPDHDYGLAYLRLAQCQQRLGATDRAAVVYQQMLRLYRGHPEATYHHGLLLAERGDLAGAAAAMREMISTLRLAPRFQRRRNRHWMLRARWWLWRNASRVAAAGLSTPRQEAQE